MSAFVNVPDFPFASGTALRRAGERLAGRGSFVLYLTNKLRHQPDSGRARREHEILRRLAPGFEEERATLDALLLPFASPTLVRTEAEAPGRGGGPAAAREERFARRAAPMGRRDHLAGAALRLGSHPLRGLLSAAASGRQPWPTSGAARGKRRKRDRPGPGPLCQPRSLRIDVRGRRGWRQREGQAGRDRPVAARRLLSPTRGSRSSPTRARLSTPLRRYSSDSSCSTTN